MTLALQRQGHRPQRCDPAFGHFELGSRSDDPEVNPGVDLPYIVSLPTYAATAWYHKRAGAGRDSVSEEVEAFATGDYALALLKGNNLSDAERQAMAARLHGYTGLPVDYLLKTNLRIEYGALQKELLTDRAKPPARSLPLSPERQRSLEQDRIHRSAGQRDRRRLHRRVQRLCPRHPGLWRRPGLLEEAGSMSMAAGITSTSRPAPASR